jgi:hypothetical protein
MEMYLNPIFPILVVSTFYVGKAGSFRGIGRHYPDMLNPPPLKFLAFVVMMVKPQPLPRLYKLTHNENRSITS